MPLRLSCPHCGNGIRLSEPYPMPGDQLQCPACAEGMAVSYPQGVVERLRERGKLFTPGAKADDSPRRAAAPSRPAAPPPPRPAPRSELLTDIPPRAPVLAQHPTAAPAASPPAPVKPDATDVPRRSLLAEATPRTSAAPSTAARPTSTPTSRPAAPPAPPADSRPAFGDRRAPANPTLVDRGYDEDAPTAIGFLPLQETPEGAVAPSPRTSDVLADTPRRAPAPTPDDKPRRAPVTAEAPRPPVAERPTEPPRPPPVWVDPNPRADAERIPVAPTERDHRRARQSPPPWVDNNPPPAPPPPRARRRWPWVALALVIAAGAAGAVGYQQLAEELPSVETLRAYQPATVTNVYAKDGTLLGEIYEKRRYVLPLKEIPKHVQDAFVAAEDGNFWTHGGIDYWSIARALWANLNSGRKSQGGSTITQQIAKNFLLTADKNFERKAKEAILSRRIEEAYSKEHILYLYLNEIFLGSQAYGVEAAARTFFGKHIKDVTLGEAAILAGLPPRPSDYNPMSNIEAALNRQRYVLDRMVALGLATAAEAEAARAEPVKIVPRNNVFLEQTPHFTEYTRRYLVERYGEDRVLNEGLQVTTTCDPELQRHAQRVVTSGVAHMDERLGLRREAIETLATEAERTKRIDEHEQAMRKTWLSEADPTGRTPVPERSVLTVGRTFPSVITQVSKRWAKVRIGAHEAIVPISWSTWIYAPDPEQSWKWRQQDDLTRKYDFTGDGKVDGPILRVGDVVQVRVEGLNTRDKKLAANFAGTPGEKAELVAARIVQTPEVESALLSFELGTGAVRAMVGGADFGRSQLNRAVQAYRQVGSTFKPIVYAAAINSKKLTAGSVLLDAELAIVNELTDEVWKPQNYDGKFMGHMTLRKALAQSRNVVTVRAMDTVDPSMRTGVVYGFARALGIGGPPTHKLPADWVVSPETDHLCPWIPETPKMSRSCIDRFPALEAGINVKDHRARVGQAPIGTWKCRECDLSLALGSASLTMEELARAYAVFGNGGVWLDPYYIEEVRDRDGNVLEKHQAPPAYQVISPELATIMNWLLEGVVEAGTATLAKAELGMHIAGKTGTTNDEKDVWFVGYTPDVITAVWVGYDQPRSLGRSSTGGAIALPLWIDYMRLAAPKEKDREFPEFGKVEWAPINEWSGHRTPGWGRPYPFLEGTLPPMAVAKSKEDPVIEDLASEM